MINRRNIVKYIGLAPVLPGLTSILSGCNQPDNKNRLDQNSTQLNSLEDYTEYLRVHAKRKGLTEATQKPIVTGDDSVNGGLQFDEGGSTPGEFQIQKCARVEDIVKRDQIDVLPYFTICDIACDETADPADAFCEFANIYFSLSRRPANTLRFVGLPSSKKIMNNLQTCVGSVSEDIFITRSDEDARRTGDGSGWFRNPWSGYECESVGVYSWTGNLPLVNPTSYPLGKGWTEIGEICINAQSKSVFAIGLGVERLRYACIREIPDWNSQRDFLLKQINKEVSSDNLPSGYSAFATS